MLTIYNVTKIREKLFSTIRDNVIFELGLFIGRLGTDKLFFVIPDLCDDLHLPSDLLGINPGKYDSTREDNNLLAALGPFTNQVRKSLKEYSYSNIIDLKDEKLEIKRIAIEQKRFWQYTLSSELIKDRLVNINQKYNELAKDLVFVKSKTLNVIDYLSSQADRHEDYLKLIQMFRRAFDDLIKSYGGTDSELSIFDMKSAINKMEYICIKFFEWELENRSLTPPDSLKELQQLQKGWTKIIVNGINQLPIIINEQVKDNLISDNDVIIIDLKIGSIPNFEQIQNLMNKFMQQIRNGEIFD
ncbi:hypothetical protein BA768_17855 [Chryseobacterium sp. CBo1]|uniref:TIR domain-containing protein n=1 Tax=Chryseobacterium sp. CBo1 TaxID=1869230 RepID=UPI000810A0B2|nr:TIR domain-containing protein [Chryseobacterium sp. CBo1]OCK51118.1 hypothetical protein BA768_17855 [Chryseobacterium sp. CBo1]